MLATRAAVFLLLGAFALPALAQFGGSAPKYYPNRSDIKYIKCQVCELLAKNAYKQAKEMAKQSTPSARVRGCLALWNVPSRNTVVGVRLGLSRCHQPLQPDHFSLSQLQLNSGLAPRSQLQGSTSQTYVTLVAVDRGGAD
jgi:hypothetical protein